MLCSNITKKLFFVIIFCAFCINSANCRWASSSEVNSQSQNANDSGAELSGDYGKPKVVGTIKSIEITESSGLVASRCNADTFWTHNDSGDGAFIFAIDAKGKKLATVRITGAKNIDWEDIAAFQDAETGECFLYVGDIGDNNRARAEHMIYRVKEPEISAGNSSKKNPLSSETAQSIKFAYPDARHDAETLLVHPQTGDIYNLSKRMDAASTVYKLAANYSLEKTNRLEKIADFTVPAIPNGFLTGGEISPDGKRLVICDYFAAYEIVLPSGARSFDQVWKQKPTRIELGERAQGEAVCYSADGNSIFATSEGKNSPIIEVDRK